MRGVAPMLPQERIYNRDLCALTRYKPVNQLIKKEEEKGSWHMQMLPKHADTMCTWVLRPWFMSLDYSSVRNAFSKSPSGASHGVGVFPFFSTNQDPAMSLENLGERSWLVVTEVAVIGSWMVIPSMEWSLQEIIEKEEERVKPTVGKIIIYRVKEE